MNLENQPASFQCQIKLCSRGNCSCWIVTWHQFPGKLWIQPELPKHYKKKITHTHRNIWSIVKSFNHWRFVISFGTKRVLYLELFFSASKIYISYIKTDAFMLVSSTDKWISMTIKRLKAHRPETVPLKGQVFGKCFSICPTLNV